MWVGGYGNVSIELDNSQGGGEIRDRSLITVSPPEFTLLRGAYRPVRSMYSSFVQWVENSAETVINILCNHAVPCMNYEHAQKIKNPYRTVCYANKSWCMHMHVWVR